MTPLDRTLVCVVAAIPLLYGAIAMQGVDQGWVILFGVVLFAAVYTTLDVLSHPARPIDQAWLRRRITINLVYLAVIGLLSIVVARLAG